MNSLSKTLKDALGIGFFGLAFIAGAAELQAAEGSAQIKSIGGTAQVGPAGGNYADAKTGKKVGEGDCIRTGNGSYVDVYLDVNGPWIRVAENSEVCIDTLSVQQIDGETVINTSLELNRGRLLGQAYPVTGLSNYEVKTPLALAKISGGDYDIRVNGFALIENGVIDLAYVAPKDSQPRVIKVEDGHFFSPETGDVSPIPPSIVDLPSRIEWGVATPGDEPRLGQTTEIIVFDRPIAIDPDGFDPGTGFVSPVQGDSGSSPESD